MLSRLEVCLSKEMHFTSVITLMFLYCHDIERNGMCDTYQSAQTRDNMSVLCVVIGANLLKRNR